MAYFYGKISGVIIYEIKEKLFFKNRYAVISWNIFNFYLYFQQCQRHFDGSYHGRKNEEIVREWLKSQPDFKLSVLLDNRRFEQLPEEISYPLAGAFAAWFIEKYTIDGYLEFYRSHAQAGAGQTGLTAGQEAVFVSDLNR